MEVNNYTGRKIAIFTDVHGLLEPMEAVISDIRRRNISEIYSLGDNIGVGPSPSDVIDMLEYYNIRSVAGNGEDYHTLGVEPFIDGFDKQKMENCMWTRNKLGSRRLDYIRCFPHSIDLEIGGKNVSLCHFANDVRTDYMLNDVSKYLYNLNNGEGYKQFLYTNSNLHFETINYNINKYGSNNPLMKGCVSYLEYPIFDGKMVSDYNAIFQGHSHRNLYECGNGIDFYSFRAMAVHFDDDPKDFAFYVILYEKNNNMGFDVERVYVPFDRERMEKTILKSDEPTGIIKKLVKM